MTRDNVTGDTNCSATFKVAVVALGVKGENKPARTESDLPLKNIHRERF